MSAQSKTWFKDRLGKELVRYYKNGTFVNTVECTEENIDNLFESQSLKTTMYSERGKPVTYTYEDYGEVSGRFSTRVDSGNLFLKI